MYNILEEVSQGGNLKCSLIIHGNILGIIFQSQKNLASALDLKFKFSHQRYILVTDPLLWPSMLILCLGELE